MSVRPCAFFRVAFGSATKGARHARAAAAQRQPPQRQQQQQERMQLHQQKNARDVDVVGDDKVLHARAQLVVVVVEHALQRGDVGGALGRVEVVGEVGVCVCAWLWKGGGARPRGDGMAATAGRGKGAGPRQAACGPKRMPPHRGDIRGAARDVKVRREDAQAPLRGGRHPRSGTHFSRGREPARCDVAIRREASSCANEGSCETAR